MRNLLAGVLLVSLCLASPAARGDELTELAKAIDAQPKDPRGYEAYAFAAMRATRNDEAIAKLKLGIALVPDFAMGYYMMASAYRNKQAWADAAGFYRSYLIQRPNDPSGFSAYYGLGVSLEQLGDPQGAAAALRRYVEVERRPTMTRYVDDAKARVARLEPNGPAPVAPPAPRESPRAEAERLKAERRLPEAVEAYRRAIEVEKGAVELYNDLGNLYFTLKRLDESVRVFQQAVAIRPDFALGWYNLAHVLRKVDRRPEAAEAFRRYIALRPDDADPYYGLGQTLKQLGDVPGAIASFRRYIELERRPGEQKWVEKARQELTALEAIQAQQPQR